jgi:hypothetical protein
MERLKEGTVEMLPTWREHWCSYAKTLFPIIYMLIYHKKAFSIQIDGWTDLKNQRFKRTLLGRSTGAHVPKQLFGKCSPFIGVKK